MECSYIAGGRAWRIADHYRRKDHSALYDGFGRVRCTFGVWQTLDEIAEALKPAGLVLRDDGTVTMADGSTPPEDM